MTAEHDTQIGSSRQTDTSVRPNFFIVGAPKCGTTALSAYLAEHPNVYFSDPKEPHFFASDLPSFQGTFADSRQYYGLFSGAGTEHRAIGEASVWYLYSDTALTAIRRELPDARIIVMLRHPADMVYSLYGQWKFTRNEDSEEFEAAWRLQNARLSGEHLPKHLRHPVRLLQYGQIGRYSQYMHRLYQVFPKDQIHVILFDDLIADPKAVYDAALAFLGIPGDGRVDFPRLNASKTSRFPLVTLLSRNSPPIISRFLNKNKAIRNLKNRVVRSIDKLNAKPAPRPTLSEEFRRELDAYFADDIRELERIIDRPLAHWLDRE